MHKNVIKGLQLGGLQKSKQKNLLNFVQFQPLLGVCKYGNGDVLSILEC